ncbi:MOSC domain-containing protein [Flavimaricola sp.]|nr:MOSC domain-containing protein [Flavimaricola sp.]MDA9019781.1 MOSC domain-containing protein [Flavimaricola sp.]
MIPMAELLRIHAAPGEVTWIGLRPKRLADLRPVGRAELLVSGLEGDHARPGKRAVTLIQAEHLPVIAALAHRDAIRPQDLRRNIVVSGINLTALHNHPIRIGGAVIRMTTPCAPCSRMEKTLGTGAYNAMRGHGGWCAEVVEPGPIQLGDRVEQIA